MAPRAVISPQLLGIRTTLVLPSVLLFCCLPQHCMRASNSFLGLADQGRISSAAGSFTDRLGVVSTRLDDTLLHSGTAICYLIVDPIVPSYGIRQNHLPRPPTTDVDTWTLISILSSFLHTSQSYNDPPKAPPLLSCTHTASSLKTKLAIPAAP